MLKKREAARKARKRIFATILIAVVLAVVLEFITWAASRKIPYAEIPDSAENLYPAMLSYSGGYEISGDVFTPTGIDSQIGFLLPGLEIQTVYIEFSKPLDKVLGIKTYFATNEEGLSESNSLIAYGNQGEACAIITLPKGVYTHIRFDIDDEFSLSGVFISPEPAEVEYYRVPPSIERTFITAILLALAIGAGQVLSRYRESMVAPLQQGKRIAAVLVRLYGGAILICLLIALVLLQVNNSSMACYSIILPNNVEAAQMVSFGIPRAIRSDEYLVGTSNFFHYGASGQLPASVLAEGSSPLIRISNVIMYLNPAYWGELFLTENYAFSWSNLVRVFFAFYIFCRLFQIITGCRRFSIAASFLMTFSPGFQWWWGPGACGLWCGFVVLFYDFFEKERVWEKLLCAWGLICCTSALIVNIYPAWDVPMIYLFAIILIAIYATKRKINFKKSDIWYICGTICLMLVVVASYFVSRSDIVTVQLESVYPGKRFNAGGGLSSMWWADYLVAPFTTWKPFTIIGSNESEISHFLHLFPIPTAIFIAKYQDFKKHKVMLGLVIFKVFCTVYMVFGIGNFLAKYSLLSYTTPGRLSTIWGLASFILLLLECYYIVPQFAGKLKKSDIFGCVFVNGSVVLFLIWVVICHQELTEYMGNYFCYIAVGLVAMANLLFWGRKKSFIAVLLGLTIVSGMFVNPINFGADVMRNTPLAREIRQIDEKEPGKWIALDSYILPKYVYAQGVDCLNYLSWPPRFDLFEPLDAAGEYRTIYNRYAHVVISLTDEDTAFKFIQADLFSLDMCVEDLAKWDVRYIVCQGQNLEDRDDVKFELVHHDELDNVYIYRVSYI